MVRFTIGLLGEWSFGRANLKFVDLRRILTVNRNYFRSLSIALLVLFMSLQQAQGSWVSDFFGVNIDIPAGRVQIGTPQPIRGIQALPDVLRRLPGDIANPAGVGLAFAIRHAKEQASPSARPMPTYIRQRLQPYFPADILSSVRFNTFVRAQVTLDSAVMMLNNDVAAITLEDITVFRSEDDAQTDYLLWAHELTHVQQYRSRGIDTFASMYTTNSWVLENEAKDHAALVYRQTMSQQQAEPPSQQQPRTPRPGRLPGPGPTSPPIQAISNFDVFTYYDVESGLYVADARSAWADPTGVAIMGLLYPCDPQTGIVIGPAVAVMTRQTAGPYIGKYIAFDGFNNAFLAKKLEPGSAATDPPPPVYYPPVSPHKL
jgi:hypothetical protein